MTYYPINEDTAKRANDANSFRDYKPGSATAAYRAEVDKAAALAEKQKAKVDPMHHDKLDGLLDRYAHRLADYYNDYYRNEAACPSILITGGANFPVAKKEISIHALREEGDSKNGEKHLRFCFIIKRSAQIWKSLSKNIRKNSCNLHRTA